MCSNEELKRSQDALKAAVDENTQAQHDTQLELGQFVASCKTWRVTRCEDNLERIRIVENGIKEMRQEFNRTIGKVAGVIAAVTFFSSLLALFIAYKTMGGSS